MPINKLLHRKTNSLALVVSAEQGVSSTRHVMDINYGPVVIDGFFDEIRIGCFDDVMTDDDGEVLAIVFIG